MFLESYETVSSSDKTEESEMKQRRNQLPTGERGKLQALLSATRKNRPTFRLLRRLMFPI